MNDTANPVQSESAPTFAAVYAFLKAHYKHERFEGRNGPIWGEDYAERITRSVIADFTRYGYRGALISRHESANGEAIRFDASLNITSLR